MENDKAINDLKRRLAIIEWTSFVVIAVAMVFFMLVNLGLSSLIEPFEMLFSELLGDKPLPAFTRLLISIGKSNILQMASVFFPFISLIILALKRDKTVAWMVALCIISLQLIEASLITLGLFTPMFAITSMY